MAYQSLGVFQNTTNYSIRNIDEQFNLVEFNKLFERNNFYLENKGKIFKGMKLNIYYVIVYFLIIIAILLLIYSNLFMKI